MIVFGIHCNIFILLPIWLKTCRSNHFPFLFTMQNVCTQKKLGASQRFCMPEHAWWAAGAQFVQAWLCNLFLCTWWDNLPKYGKVWYIFFRHCTYYSLWWICFVCRFCDTFVNHVTWVAAFIQNTFQFINFTMKFDQKQRINEKNTKIITYLNQLTRLAKFLLQFLTLSTTNEYTDIDSFHFTEEICHQIYNNYRSLIPASYKNVSYIWTQWRSHSYTQSTCL